MTLDRCLVVASGFCLDTRPSLLRMSSQVPEWDPRSSEKAKDEARTLRTMSRIAVQTSGSASAESVLPLRRTGTWRLVVRCPTSAACAAGGEAKAARDGSAWDRPTPEGLRPRPAPVP